MELIKKEIIKKNQEYLKNFKRDLKEESAKETKKEYNHFDWILERYTTKKQFEKYQNKKATKSETIKKAIERRKKEIDKNTIKELEKLETIKNAPTFTDIEIVVDWVKSNTWGHNPHATVRMWNGETFEQYEGRASGCGYDKESAAIASALNQCNGLLKVFTEYKEKQLKKNRKADKNAGACTGIDNRNAICYGFGYDCIPYFEGGTGTNCFLNGFELLGYKTQQTHTEKIDIYRIYKEN